jgi:hypothetical protein
MANVGEVKDRDLLAQAADFLLNRDGVTTTFIYGICGDVVRVSARTKDISLHLGQKLREAYSEIGSGGGHARMAGATVPLSYFGKTSKAAINRDINKIIGRKFLEVVGLVKPQRQRKKKKAEAKPDAAAKPKAPRAKKPKLPEQLPQAQRRLL